MPVNSSREHFLTFIQFTANITRLINISNPFVSVIIDIASVNKAFAGACGDLILEQIKKAADHCEKRV